MNEANNNTCKTPKLSMNVQLFIDHRSHQYNFFCRVTAAACLMSPSRTQKGTSTKVCCPVLGHHITCKCFCLGQVSLLAPHFSPLTVILLWLSILMYHPGVNDRPFSGCSSETFLPHLQQQQ
jgi:hypothetical protein